MGSRRPPSASSDDLQEALHLTTKGSKDPAFARGANLIFTSELFAVDSVAGSLGTLMSATTALILVGDEAEVQAPERRCPNHPLAQELIRAFWILVARDSISFRIERDGSTSDPAEAPSGGRPPVLGINRSGPL